MKRTIITKTSTDASGVVTSETVETIEENETTSRAVKRPAIVQFLYHGKRRVVEAFEIKFATGTRNILLVGQEVGCDHPKAFIVDEIVNADFTNVRFVAVGAERTVWTEGEEAVPASESYDEVTETIVNRLKAHH